MIELLLVSALILVAVLWTTATITTAHNERVYTRRIDDLEEALQEWKRKSKALQSQIDEMNNDAFWAQNRALIITNLGAREIDVGVNLKDLLKNRNDKK